MRKYTKAITQPKLRDLLPDRKRGIRLPGEIARRASIRSGA